MLGNHGRSVTQVLFTPVARLLARMHVTPNMVTYFSTLLVATLSILLLARGYWIAGPLALGALLWTDSIDGILARLTGQGTRFGAFLDSTMDRISDGFVFGSLLWWSVVGFSPSPARTVAIGAGIASMCLIGAVPYARSRAETLGVAATVGVAERTDRLIVGLVGAFITGFGLSEWFYTVGILLVAVGSLITVIQRIAFTARALREPG